MTHPFRARFALVLLTLAGCATPTSPAGPIDRPFDPEVELPPELMIDPGAPGLGLPPPIALPGADPTLRLISPLSGERVWSVTPKLVAEVSPDVEAARIDVCADRACSEVEHSGEAIAIEGRVSWSPPSALREGPHFFRVFGVRDGVATATSSATWQLDVRAPRAGTYGGHGGFSRDVDGDGIDDLITHARTVHLHRVSADGSMQRILMSAPFLVQRAEIVGDLDGDALADVALVGAGEIQVWYGGAWDGGAARSTRLERDDRAGAWGSSVVGVGDLDGDGFGDLAIGSQSRLGEVMIHRGGPEGVETRASIVLANPGPSFCNRWSSRLAPIGDVDRDGYGDLAIGGDYAPIHVYRGGPSLVARQDEPWAGTATADLVLDPGTGASLSIGAQGDADGDGRPELLVIATDRSAAWTFYGLESGAPVARAVEVGGCGAWAADDASSWIGDVDGDAVPDRSLGVCGGKLGVATRTEVRWIDLALPEGAEVRPAGDLDGDGIDDLWIPEGDHARIVFGGEGAMLREVTVDATC